jgi:hypothetical protein
MACCLLLAALLTRINEWLRRNGRYRAAPDRTNLFPTTGDAV